MTVWGWVGECGGAKENLKTNNSAFSATHTYIKLTLVSFFFTFFSMHLSLRSFSVECPSPWWQWQCLNNCNNCALIGEGGFVEGLLDSENAGKVFFFQTIIPSLHGVLIFL